MKLRIAVVLAIFLIFNLGCSSPNATVTGIVTLGSEKLDSGSVVFFPEDDGTAASGNVGADGEYTLSVGSSKRPGLPPGDYVAVVTAVARQSPNAVNPPPTIIPARYMDRSKSPLRFSLKAGPNRCDLVLEK